MQYQRYIFATFAFSACLYALLIVAMYKVESTFHLPVYNHVSLDAKLHFLKHQADLEQADTIILGSSMGLNNINGPLLEDASPHVEKVVNISAWHMKCTALEPFITNLVQNGNAKRIIYIAQYLDFTGTYHLYGPSDKTVFGYLHESPLYTLLFKMNALNNIFNLIDDYLRWESMFTNTRGYQNLAFDRTGGALLDINESNAHTGRWGSIDAPTLAPLDEENLNCLDNLASLSQTNGINFYFVISPFREALIESSPELQRVMTDFDVATREILHHEHTYHINTHQMLNLDDSNFADKSHLNIKGATTKTNTLVEILQGLYPPN